MNVLGPANPDWHRRQRLLAQTLKALDADIVALQDVPFATEPDVVDELLDRLRQVTQQLPTPPLGPSAC